MGWLDAATDAVSSAVDSVTGGSESSSDGSSSSGSSGYGDTFSSGSSGQSFRDAQAGGGSSSGGSSSPSNDSGGGLLNDARNTVDNTVDDARNAVDNTVDDARNTVDNTVDDAQNTVDNTVDDAVSGAQNVADTAGDVASNVSRSANEVADATRDQIDHAEDANSEIEREIERGDVGAAVDTAVESTDETYDNIARAGDAAAGSTDEYVGGAEVNTDVSDDLTRGGLLSETRESNDGLLPGEVGGVGLSEAGFRRAAENVNDFKETFDENEPVTIAGSDVPERVLQGAAGAGVDLLNVPSHIAMAETGVEVAANAPSAIQEYGAGEVAETATGVGAAAGTAMANEATENPVEFASGLGFDVLTGAGIAKAGKEVSTTASALRKTRVDAPDVTNRDTLDYYEGGNANPENQFPSFRPEDYNTQGDPAETFRRQGEDFTPDEIKTELGETSDTETYATHGTNYDFDSEFEAGIEKSRPSDPDNVMFVGPEFSPNFAGFGSGGSGLSSLRPRLPRISDFRGGGDKQMIISKMDVDKVPKDVGPEARTGDSPMAPGDESEYLADEASQGRAYVRNAQNRNLGEAEALVPGGSTFRELPGSGDYYTEVDGETVDIRLFESADADPMSSPDAESGGLYTVDELPSSGGTSPEGTPAVPIGGLGYDGGAASGTPSSGGGSPADYNDPYNGGGFGDDAPGNVLDVDFGDFGDGPGRSPGADGPGSTRPNGDGGGPTSPPNSGGPSGGDRSPFPGETGVPTGSPGSGGPSSGSPGSPTSPPGSGSPPSSPPESPPTPPQGETPESGDPTTPVSSPPGGSPFTPITGPESQSTRPRRWSPESDPKKKKEEDGLEIFGTSSTYGYGVDTAGGLVFGSSGSKSLDEVSGGSREASKRTQSESIGLDDIL